MNTSGVPAELATPDPGRLMDSTYRWIALYLLLAGIISTVGNGTVIYVILRKRELCKNTHNLLLLNLAIADVGFTLAGYPFTAASALRGRWIWGHTLCILYGFLCTTLAITDINTLLVLSVYRYIVICKPQLAYIIKDRRYTYLSIGACWGWSLFWSVSALLGWNRYEQEAFGTSCSIAWDSRSFADAVYTVLMTLLCYVSHIAVMVYCYFQIHLRSRSLTSRLLAKRALCLEDAIVINQVRNECHMTSMALLMVGCFVVIWSPYAWVAFWRMANPGLSVGWTTLPTLFAKSAPMLNPIIYTCTNARRDNDNRVFTISTTKDGVYIGKRSIMLPIDGPAF